MIYKYIYYFFIQIDYITNRYYFMALSESNLIILLMVALVLFFIYKHNNYHNTHNTHNTQYNENFGNTDDNIIDDTIDDITIYSKNKSNKSKKYNQHNKDSINNYIDAMYRSTKSQSNKKYKNSSDIQTNSDFVEMQYHLDYNDTMTAINNLTSQKELFNLSFLPVKQSVPDTNNINDLVKLFMDKLNNEVKSNVSEYLHVNSGWNDMGKRRREKSGFEEQMEELGLPGSVYNEPASKAPIKLIKIDKAEQYNTDDQIRFVAYIIVQKVNVKDQMVLKVQFFMEREDLKTRGDDRASFFEQDINKNDDNYNNKLNDQVVIIEQVFTVGYLTNETKSKTKMDKFHDYSGVQRLDGTVDQEKIVKIMLQKHRERANELNSFMCTLDDETKEVHDVPNIDNYSVYKNTRTIMDDLARFPQHSFGDIPI